MTSEWPCKKSCLRQEPTKWQTATFIQLIHLTKDLCTSLECVLIALCICISVSQITQAEFDAEMGTDDLWKAMHETMRGARTHQQSAPCPKSGWIRPVFSAARSESYLWEVIGDLICQVVIARLAQPAGQEQINQLPHSLLSGWIIWELVVLLCTGRILRPLPSEAVHSTLGNVQHSPYEAEWQCLFYHRSSSSRTVSWIAKVQALLSLATHLYQPYQLSIILPKYKANCLWKFLFQILLPVWFIASGWRDCCSWLLCLPETQRFHK